MFEKALTYKCFYVNILSEHKFTLMSQEIQRRAQMSEEIKVTIINTHKDRLFKIIFNEKKKLLSLYNALADTEYTD